MTLRASSNGSAPKRSRTGMVLAASAAALAAAAVYNTYRARQVERKHPPSDASSTSTASGSTISSGARAAGGPAPRQRRDRRGLDPERRARPCRRAAPRHRLRPPRLRLQRAAARLGVDGREPGRAPSPRLRTARHRAPGRGRALLGDERCPGDRPRRPGSRARPGPDLRLLQPDPAGGRVAGGTCGAVPVLGDVLRYTVSPLFGAATCRC